MTVLDSSAAADYLLGSGVAAQVDTLLAEEGPAFAPDLLTFEVLSVMRRGVFRGDISEQRALGAVNDLGSVSIVLFPSLPLRSRAFALRHNLTVGDALFAALAELRDEPLMTKDRALARAAAEHTEADVVLLEEP